MQTATHACVKLSLQHLPQPRRYTNSPHHLTLPSRKVEFLILFSSLSFSLPPSISLFQSLSPPSRMALHLHCISLPQSLSCTLSLPPLFFPRSPPLLTFRGDRAVPQPNLGLMHVERDLSCARACTALSRQGGTSPLQRRMCRPGLPTRRAALARGEASTVSFPSGAFSFGSR